MKNRQTTARRSEQQAIVCDLVEWLQILTELDKRPCLVVNVNGLVHIPKFQLKKSMKQLYVRKYESSMNAMFPSTYCGC